MPSQPSRLRVRRDGDITQVNFLDRNILDESFIQQIGDEIVGIVGMTQNPKLLLCFLNVDHLSSSAIGMLLDLRKKLGAINGRMKLSDIDPQIFEVFKITKLDGLFEIHATADEARKAFGHTH